MSQQEPIKLAADGNPFKSQKAADDHVKSAELNTDIWGVMKHRGGWAVAKHSYIAQALTEQATARPAKPAEETYSWVEFNQKANENDLPYVPLSKNGMQLRIQRGRRVVLPDSFLEIAMNASHPQWEPSDNAEQPMKRVGTIQRYQFRKIETATAEDFKKMLADGNLITHEAVERIQRQSAV